MNKKIYKYIVVIACFFSYIESGMGIEDQEGLSAEAFQQALASIKDPFSSPVPVKKPAPPVLETKKEVQGAKPLVVGPLTVPQPMAAVKPPVVSITGIVWNSDKPIAIMNGQVVAIGQEAAGCVLLAVRRNEVDVMHKSVKFTLPVQQGQK